MGTQLVTYELDAETVVQFEIEPSEGFHPVGASEVLGRVRDAVRPAVEAAREVLTQIAALQPAETQVKFGVKANGTANWVVAKAATEASFEVTLTWRPAASANGS
ncbi:CU044_2847 family protein [Streptomyces sp. H39-S7]|uniref:CU044_2847 family protein n=1 Tax=Streptomyces sp. H39-S7 TaxID=3004357 RepID=UPI0022AEACEA|nr:CU044_2847 family protein [Streptomyces sp. H39-S7]MCZ4117929.1 CU044_2847 family protein [Streptomyces sp. H39-S7]